MSILFLDTESDPDTKKPECITFIYGNIKRIIEYGNEKAFFDLKHIWNDADAVILFNAPYDLGVLSIFFKENSYEWVIKNDDPLNKSAFWFFKLFGNLYDVRKISAFRNMIKPHNQKSRSGLKRKHRKGSESTPVIDLLKLWSILISETDIGLKSLIRKEFHEKPIPYTPENSKTDSYRYQDVIYLKKLWDRFLEKIDNIEEIKYFSFQEWAYIKTPATFTKLIYEKYYPKLKKYHKDNDKIIDHMGLKNALESAFHGGITLALHRGNVGLSFWLDIKGAYSKAIEVLNTDQYLSFDIEKVDIKTVNFDNNNDNPFLLECQVNFVMQSLNKSLKLYYVKERETLFLWSYDIIACKNLIPDFEYKILNAYRPIPGPETKEIKESLPVKWNNAKNEENKKHGKTTLYQFYKYLSNTSYGIKAQRKPFVTNHTNMIIAGMITAKVHQILCTIIKTVSDNGYENKYNDTDSVNARIINGFNENIVNIVNDKIKPFEVDFEGKYDKTIILSLKRYISIKDLDKYNEKGFNEKQDKIKLHGKGRYDVKGKDLSGYVMAGKIEKEKDGYMKLIQLAGNTAIGIKMILNIYKENYPQYYEQLKQYVHPFMFIKDIPTKTLRSEWFKDWFYHIDTKTSFEKHGEYNRGFHVFTNSNVAKTFFEMFKGAEDVNGNGNGDDINENFREWDNEILEDFFNAKVAERINKQARIIKRPKETKIQKDLFDYESYTDSSLTDHENKKILKDLWKDYI